MKRRNFVKKSIASAIVAATPMALTGLVQAAGGSGMPTSTNSTDWWGTTISTDNSTNSTDWWSSSTDNTSDTQEQNCKANLDQEYLDSKLNLQGELVSAVCWFPVSGCENSSTCGETSMQRTCKLDVIDEALAMCLSLPPAPAPIKCIKLIDP